MCNVSPVMYDVVSPDSHQSAEGTSSFHVSWEVRSRFYPLSPYDRKFVDYVYRTTSAYPPESALLGLLKVYSLLYIMASY